jgi:hypothetical protein
MPVSGQQKSEEEYSKNENTMRARKRRMSMDPIARKKESARDGDKKACTTKWKKIANSDAFKSASDPMRKALLMEGYEAVMEKRWVPFHCPVVWVATLTDDPGARRASTITRSSRS